jgi:hypothetical protein
MPFSTLDTGINEFIKHKETVYNLRINIIQQAKSSRASIKGTRYLRGLSYHVMSLPAK